MSEARDWNRVRDWNSSVIEEFRAHEGRVGGHFEDVPVLLLHTIGAKSALERVNPMLYLDLDGHRYVFASAGGAGSHPDWYHNLVAYPEVTVEVGTETYAAIARPVAGDERDRIYAEQARRHAQFARYQTLTNRLIPVVELHRS